MLAKKIRFCQHLDKDITFIKINSIENPPYDISKSIICRNCGQELEFVGFCGSKYKKGDIYLKN